MDVMGYYRENSEVCPTYLYAKWGFSFMYYVYILRLIDGTYYTGYSSNLRERVKEHHKALISSTKNLIPVELVFYSAFRSKIKALNFEKYLKTGSGFAFRNKRLI